MKKEQFITVGRMTPDEYKNGGENLTVDYSFATTPFGDILMASTPRGICRLEFADNHSETLLSLQKNFPHALLKESLDNIQRNTLLAFTQGKGKTHEIRLHLKGTDFQIKVWKALLEVPMGETTTYGDIAAAINNPQACRAVGSAVGANPVAFLIPCHRVVRSSGDLGHYHWGKARKAAILEWELRQSNPRCHRRNFSLR